MALIKHRPPAFYTSGHAAKLFAGIRPMLVCGLSLLFLIATNPPLDPSLFH